MVFQSYAIWPHMTVFDNVAYGLRGRRRPEAEVASRVREALELVQLGDLGTRSASKLSGGQQQRVALARAFAFSPTVLLFDEPLSNLDAKLRAEMRVELKELQRRLDITSVYVTHDLEEALAISDRVVVMREQEREGQTTDGVHALPSTATNARRHSPRGPAPPGQLGLHARRYPPQLHLTGPTKAPRTGTTVSCTVQEP
jgi:ABC-type Fe3+/spermidine/putrescine transport system ATPase subunit